MPYDRFKHHRRSIRLKGYDYAAIGAYYITICVWGRECLLGEIIDDKMVLNEFGRIVYDEWAITPEKRTNIILDVFVVMPNHLHGIFIITENRGGIGLDGKVGKSYGDDPGHAEENRTENPGCMGEIHGVNPRCKGVLRVDESGYAENHAGHPRCKGVLRVDESGYAENHAGHPRCKGVLQYAPTYTYKCTSHTPTHTHISHTSHMSDGLRSPSQTVGAVVRGFKGAVTKRINQLCGAPGSPVWQRNYYERIIRNQNEFDRIRRYIINNPANWNKDIEHPSNPGATIKVPDDICKEV